MANLPTARRARPAAKCAALSERPPDLCVQRTRVKQPRALLASCPRAADAGR